MWTEQDESHIINRECVVCVKKMSCKILDPLIAEDAKSFQPKEWNASIKGVDMIPDIQAHCTVFEGNPVIMKRREKREESIRRQYEKKKETERQLELAKQVAAEPLSGILCDVGIGKTSNGHVQEGNIVNEPTTDERTADAH